MLELTLAATATAVATGLGVVPVVVLGPVRTAALHRWLSGAAALAMGAAGVAGLSAGDDPAAVTAGAAAGVAFLLAVRRRLERRGHWILVALVLTAHSLPEGLAIGTSYAADPDALGLFVVFAIALQNVPEGTATAVPMQARGFGPLAMAGAAIATSLPQIPGALGAYLLVEELGTALSLSLGFASGAMLALVFTDLLPDALSRG